MSVDAKIPPGLVSAPLVSDWVQPAGGGFAVRTGRAELGQGVQSALLRIASWELCVPVETLTISGPDTAASPDEGLTAGSLSITQGGKALRAATSAARVLCLAEAARRLNASPDTLSVIDGLVINGDDKTELNLATLATEVDLNVPVADHAAPLGQPEDAKETARPDLRERMIGAPFVHDMTMTGLLFGRVFPPPTLTARLPKDLDLHSLHKKPGIVAVVRDGSFLGLVANSVAEADSAATWVETRLEWEGIDLAPQDPQALLEASNAPMELILATGSAEPTEQPTIDLTCQRPFLSHAPMAPSAALAKWEDGKLSVWSHTQGVYPLRKALASACGLAEESIQVVHVYGPGCYGHNGADDVAMDVALLARAVPGQPVRLVWSRAAEFQTAPLGAAMSTRVRLWMNGRQISAGRVSVTSPPHSTRPGTAGAPFFRSGTLLSDPQPFTKAPDLPPASGHGAARNARPIYDAPVLVERKLVNDLPWRTSALRGLGAQLNVYAIETALEAALIADGQDPFEGRLANLTDPRARAVLERLRTFGGDLMTDSTEDRGWGIGLARYKGTGGWAAVMAEVALGDDIRVPRVRVVADIGEVIDPDGARNQLEGGVVQAISWTLKEAVTLDGARVAGANWEEYPILPFSEVPDVQTDIMERPGEPPLGCAEAVAGPVTAAVGNAVQRLLGVAIQSLPITRDRIVAAVSAA
jgi:nicotinate dehydrogenase subunit B